MKVAMLVVDGRECYKDYSKTEPYFGPAQDALFQGMAQLSNVEVHVISCWQRPLPASAKLAPNIWFHGLVVPKIGWMRTGYQGCIRAVRKKVRELQADIAHGQGTERECGMSAVFSGVPNVITIHGNMAAISKIMKSPIGSYGWCAGKLETFALTRTGGIFCNSTHTEALVRHRARQTWRVANPIREQFFNVPQVEIPSQRCVLINVGFISALKRQLELLRLARELHDQRLDFELHFIGKANEDDDYTREFMIEIKVAEKLGYARYLGPKSVSELIECLDRACGMIHVAREESFGLAVAEGLARNLKLFGSKVGGLVDIAAGIEDAELFPEEDWRGLANAIARWIKAGAPRSTTGSAIRKRYGPCVISRIHLDIYEQFVAAQQ